MHDGFVPELIQQAFRYALAPTPAQDAFLSSCAGASRFWFNQGLALVKERLDERDSGAVVRVPWSYNDLCSEIERTRRAELAPWQSDVVCGSYQAGFEALGKALQNFSAGRRAGRKVGFPGFRRKGACTESVIFQRPRIRDARHVALDRRLGDLRTKESLRKLTRLLARDPRARVLRSTVSRSGRGWAISFTVQRSAALKRASRVARRPSAVVGVDVGLTHLAALSTAETVANARPLRKSLRKLRRLQRQLERQRRANNPANYTPDGRIVDRAQRQQWRFPARQVATQERVRRLHERVANVRNAQAHRLSSALVAEFGVIGVESLAVKNMMANRRLARHIADVGWAAILAQLAYKSAWAGGTLDTCNPASNNHPTEVSASTWS